MERGEAVVDSELRRRRWIVNRKLQGWRSTEIATALRIDERTVYRWWHVYRKQGIQASVNELDRKLGSLREELIQIFQVKIRESEEKLRAASNRN